MRIENFMTPRLLTVADMVNKCRCVADIGTDHAYIPIYLMLNKKTEFALAMDINRGPLLRAKENIEKFLLTDYVTTRQSDGLKNLENNEADVVVIAGMGGILINTILEEGKERLSSVKQYILQPMTAIEETRKYLYNNGFTIVNEKLAKEDSKIYTIISAVFDKASTQNESEIDYYIGKCLIDNKDEFLSEYLDGKIYEYEKAVTAMENSSVSDVSEKRDKYIKLLNEFKKIREDCAKW